MGAGKAMSGYTVGDLKSILYMRREINDYAGRIAAIRSSAENMTSRAQEGSRGTAEQDKMAATIARAIDLAEELFYKAIECEERIQEMENAMDKLPSDYKTILMYRYSVGLEWTLIADLTHNSIATCYRHHRRALDMLKDDSQ
jgi:DNA-directed RNA polymerase specialized sigma24 family protein